MKIKYFLSFLILLGSARLAGESFEGTLTYVTDMEVSKNFIDMGMTKEMLLDKMKKDGSWADTIHTSYKVGNYYSLLNTQPRSWMIYTAGTNKIYSMQEGDGKDMCTVTDAAIDLEFTITGKMPKVMQLDTSAIVNGITCKIVRVEWGSGTYDYYYNPTMLKVDAALFSKHVYDGWAEYLKISHALPLKIVKSSGGMLTVTQTLIATNTAPVSDAVFSIPVLVPDKSLNILKAANREIMRIKK